MKLNLLSLVALPLFTLLLPSCVTQPTVPVETTEVVEVSGQGQRAIYDKSRQWFSEYFVSGESVVDYEDPQAGTIIGKGVGKIGTYPLGIIEYNIKYTLRIDTKDGRFKVSAKVLQH
ncbi:MAG: DUF4468 domain-containing protein, partial [Prosthecobacter sp.]|nr:DUF4468 domain-containing protein [Prosthecobacter sp.]